MYEKFQERVLSSTFGSYGLESNIENDDYTPDDDMVGTYGSRSSSPAGRFSVATI